MLYGAIEKRVRVTAKSTYGMIWINPLEKIGTGRLGEYGVQIHPRRYAHLVEFGTRHSRPKSFMRAAMINRRDEAMARLTEKARERLDIEWGKADAKGGLL